MPYEIHFSDGIRQMTKAKTPQTAQSVARKLVRDNKHLQFVDVYRNAYGFHSTTQEEYLIAWYGDGQYWDNVSKKKPELLKKKLVI